MSWVRTGDNASTNPIVLRVLSIVRGSTARVLEREVIKAELFGTVTMWATLSTAHDQDYVVSYGTACTVSGPRADRLLDLAVSCGYMTKVSTAPGEEERWLIIDDPEFLHMRTKAEKDFEAQRRKDAANPALVVPVRLRDGDGCRYCGNVVIWGDTKSARAATYDHRIPGQPATVATYVVACRSCNSARRDDPDADDRLPLLPVPASPYYSARTLAYLANHGQRAALDDPSDPAASRASHPATHPGHRGSAATASASSADGSADPAGRRAAGSGFAGSGRVGSGRDSPQPAVSAARRRQRGRRGGRNRNSPTTENGQ